MTNPFTNEKTRGYTLSGLSALLIILSFPKISWSPLAWIAFIPLFRSLVGKTGRQRFWLGYFSGIISSLGLFYWVTYSMRHYGNLDPLTSFSILFLMVLYLALYNGAFAWLWGLQPGSGLFNVLWSPAIWVGLEYIRTYLLTGFPWALLGYTQYNLLPLIQSAEYIGVYGISFILMAVNEALNQCFFGRGTGRPLFFQRLLAGVGAALLIAFTLIFGLQTLTREKQRDLQSQQMRVAIMQGNIDQSLKWNPLYQDQTIQIYRDLTLKGVSFSPDLTIWPETAVPFYFLHENRLTPAIFSLTQEANTHLLFGSPAYGFKDGQLSFYNRAYLLSPQGRVSYYDKVHLVPFGEYIPLKRLLPFVGKVVQAIGDFSPGPGSYGLALPKGKVGVLICFETIFPDLSRSLKKEDCRLLVNLTNDAWFGRTSAPYQHLSMLTFRAVENRVWIARAANTGFSAVIDASGRIVQHYPLFQRGGLHAIIPMRTGTTFYTRHGDLLIYFCALIFILGTGHWYRRKRSRDKSQ